MGRVSKRIHRGRVKIALPVSAAARRVLHARGSLKVQVKATFRPKGGGRPKVMRRPFMLHPVG